MSFFRSNIHQKSYNQEQGCNYLKSGNRISQINHFFLALISVKRNLIFHKSKIKEKKEHKTKQSYAISNSYFNIYIFKINFFTLNTHIKLLTAIANNKLNIPRMTLIVNNLRLNFDFLTTAGKMKADPNQPAARLIRQSATVVNTILSIILSYHISQKGLLKLTKKTLISTFILWFVILGSGLIYLFNPFIKKTEAAWFNDNWGYSI